MWGNGAFSTLFRHIFLRLEAKGRFQGKRKEKQRKDREMHGIILRGVKIPCVFAAANPDLKLNAELRSERREYMREIACGEKEKYIREEEEARSCNGRN